MSRTTTSDALGARRRSCCRALSYRDAMGEPEPYKWEWERSAWDSDSRAETFSVGVYQWVPMARGKGLKKSRSIRVQGYTAEPLRVYAQAQELCDRLNAEAARADAPPSWLRKQCTVPRPAGHEPPPREGLTGDRVRTIRTRVMKERLLPEGFQRVRGGTYVRAAGEQIHLIDFQAERLGQEYYVNLGFHYRFVPSYSLGALLPPEQFGLTHCAVSTRLRAGADSAAAGSFLYGEDAYDLAEAFARNARDSLAHFERYACMWEEPAWWIEAAPRLRQNPWIDAWLVRWPEIIAGAAAVRLGRGEEAASLLAPLLTDTTPEHIRRMAASLLP